MQAFHNDGKLKELAVKALKSALTGKTPDAIKHVAVLEVMSKATTDYLAANHPTKHSRFCTNLPSPDEPAYVFPLGIPSEFARLIASISRKGVDVTELVESIDVGADLALVVSWVCCALVESIQDYVYDDEGEIADLTRVACGVANVVGEPSNLQTAALMFIQEAEAKTFLGAKPERVAQFKREMRALQQCILGCPTDALVSLSDQIDNPLAFWQGHCDGVTSLLKVYDDVVVD